MNHSVRVWLCLHVVCVQVLQQLASLQPAVDEDGSVLQPLPRAHRGIADPACLPHIAQVMLTGEVGRGGVKGRRGRGGVKGRRGKLAEGVREGVR